MSSSAYFFQMTSKHRYYQLYGKTKQITSRKIVGKKKTFFDVYHIKKCSKNVEFNMLTGNWIIS